MQSVWYGFGSARGARLFTKAGHLARPLLIPKLLVTILITCSSQLFGAEEQRTPSFRYDVLPALSKQGCSSGACHGSPNGKGGFRLSLRGFDPKLDYFTLTREARARRTNPFEPSKSLLLLKPTMRVSHGGGLRLERNDLAFCVLHRWIAVGCPDDKVDAPECKGIELQTSKVELRWPSSQQLSVRANFSDGSDRDITLLTVFSSSDESVATVDGAGLVTAKSGGEATIVARYLDFFQTVRVSVWKPVDGFVWKAAPANDEIDRIVFRRLKKLQISPSPRCTDSEFIRRVYLDVLGILPTRNETESFLADSTPGKRRRLIDGLLERIEYAEFWAQKRADLLRVNSNKLGQPGVIKFYRWLVDSVHDNMPYDRFSRELLTAQGSTLANPPANFYRAAADPKDCAESFSQLFLGVRIQCAKCHNHPFDRWSQDNYYGISAFFSRVDRKSAKPNDDVLISLADKGEIKQPRTGETMKPWVPIAGTVELPAEDDRRAFLSRWLTSPDNPFFARVAVNRIWAQLFGRGIVDPVDDFRADNPPSHPDLLDALAQSFVESGYNQKELIRRILNSRVYQLSSKTNLLNEHDDKYFSHAYSRLLDAEQLLDAISHVSGVRQRFVGLPPDTRATSLPSPDFGNDFLKVFGQPARNTVCDCERTRGPKLAQALELINGPTIEMKLRDSHSRVAKYFDDLSARLAAAGQPPDNGLTAWFRADAGVFSNANDSAFDGSPVARWANQASRTGLQPVKDRRGLAHFAESSEQNEPVPLSANDSDGSGLLSTDATQESASRRPAFVASSIGGLPALHFDGKDDFLHNAETRLLESGASRTVIVVGRLDDQTGGALFTFGRQRQNGSSVFTAQHVTVGGKYYVYSDGVNASGNTTIPDERLQALNEPFVTAFVSAGNGHKLRVRVNGTELPTTQPGSVGADKGVAGFTIGSREDIPPGQQIWHGVISEILVYDRALSDEQLRVVGSYLATKYKLATSYPQVVVKMEPKVPDEEIVTDLYFAAFCRPPSETELQVAVQHVNNSASRRPVLEDIAWALMNSKEFLFQH